MLNDKESLICWEHPNGLRITSADHYLLNRVLAIPSLLFKDFIKADQEYAQREFEAYLGFSFNAFAGIGSESPKGLAVNVPSLPQQWKAVNTAFRLNTPVFFWGMKQYKALAGNAKLVYSTVYNFLNWVVCAKEPEEELLFCFEKPPGQPVFILSLGHKQLITTRFKLSTAIQLRLKTLANRINALFNYFISEILFFVDAENCYFACINHEIIRSEVNPEFCSLYLPPFNQ